MLDKKTMHKLKTEYKMHRTLRHKLIGEANDLLRLAKQAIFSLHRNDVKKAKATLDEIKKALQALQKGMLKKNPTLKLQGAYLAAVEEYVEAELFYQALTAKRIETIKSVEIGAEQYIGGVCDMTGELTRRAVIKATEKDFDEVEKYGKIVEDVAGSLLQFDLVGQYRQKYDDVKRNLKRIEGIRYDISLRAK